MSAPGYWVRLGTGLIVPRRIADGQQEAASATYLKVKQMAERLEALFKENSLPLHPSSGLGVMIEAAKKLSDEWIANSAKSVPDEDLFRAAHLNQIATVVLDLSRDQVVHRHLDRLIGAWDPLREDRSEAADFFWEMQCLHSLRGFGIKGVLQEPPDLVVTINGVEIGIACKKIHSARGGGKRLSKGVAQTQQEFECGVVAFNLDALYEPWRLHEFDTIQHARKTLDQHNLEFLRTYEHRLRDYMTGGRTLAGFASTGVLAAVPNGGVLLSTVRSTTLWNIPNLPEPQHRAMSTLQKALQPE